MSVEELYNHLSYDFQHKPWLCVAESETPKSRYICIILSHAEVSAWVAIKV